jgi:hypothetical protein
MHEFFDRFIEIVSDPTNKKIFRHKKAGTIENDYIYMHNGVKIYMDSYYGSFSDIFIINRGVHEPQEEYIFSLVLDKIKKINPVTLELGSYWAFYSLSILEKIPESRCFLIEPGEFEISCGIRNFELNKKKGTFVKNNIGVNGISVDLFLKNNNIEHLDILHSDIQGYEMEMLKGSVEYLSNKKIDYIFISTHSNGLHNDCIDFLEKHDYHIICSINLDETYCCDGIIVAQSKNLEILSVYLDKKNKDLLISKIELFEILNSNGIIL